MIKAVIDFVADGRHIKAGDEIGPDTLTADTLLQSLFDKGWIVRVEPLKVESEKAVPVHKTGKKKTN
jgi:hypothetical protein